MLEVLYLGTVLFPLYICYTDQSADGTLRLSGGGSPHRGKLEISHQNSYGGVCDSNFGSDESRVACYQLGFSVSVSHYEYGQAQDPILTINDCEATGTWLANCSRSGWRDGVCGSGQYVGLECDGECV